ncbi:MAG TPA: hypothetical protein VLJ39_00825 [Tepidisphaeraceae bacterium]|nr:hypothetical protein [Tepidisphaeraceae bacterium]
MPSTLSIARRRKAFDEGRRSAQSETALNPYDNLKLKQLWDLGRTQQRSGELKTPIPPLKRGETRATRAPHNPPHPKRPGRPAGPGPFRGGSSGPRFGDRGGPRFGDRGPRR